MYASVTFLRDVFGVSTVCLYSMKGHWNQSVLNVLSSLRLTTPSPRLDPYYAKYTVKIYADRENWDDIKTFLETRSNDSVVWQFEDHR